MSLVTDVPVDALTETYRSLGKLEAEVEFLKAEMREQTKKLDHVVKFIDEAGGAKKAVIAMWFIAGSVGALLTTGISHLVGLFK